LDRHVCLFWRCWEDLAVSNGGIGIVLQNIGTNVYFLNRKINGGIQLLFQMVVESPPSYQMVVGTYRYLKWW
jgi:hypothetical protein